MRKVKKQTSSRVSTLAAKLMAKLTAREGGRPVYSVMLYGLNAYGAAMTERDISLDVKALCASLISQDETRGQAKKRGRK